MLRIAKSGDPADKTPSAANSRENRNVRLLRLALLLVSKPAEVHVSAFAGRHGVSRRTLYRDLQVLRRAGFDVSYDARGGHYRLEVGESLCEVMGELTLPPASSAGREEGSPLPSDWPLNWEESVALIAALRAASVPPGTEWRQRLQSAAGSIERWVSSRFDTQAGSIAAHATLLLSRSDLSLRQMRQTAEKSIPERSSA